MTAFRFALCLAGALVAASQSGAADEKAFVPADFSGWEGLKDYWSYKDGALVGSTETTNGLKFNTFLCSRDQYSDFELSFQIRLKGGQGNSGVQIRSKIINQDTLAVGGPQCDIGSFYWGSLYGEHFGGPPAKNGIPKGGMMKQSPPDVVKRVLKADDFNDYYIKCVGNHVTIKLNGETTVDDDFPKMPPQGIIAWQLHQGGPMEVTFRNIRFTDLSTKK